MKKLNSVQQLILCVIFTEAIGIIGAYFTMPAIPGWYAGLQKPSFNPPNWLFGPVWTILYLLMGIALFLIWRRDRQKQEVRSALLVFALQLMLNLLWTVAFFGLKWIFGGVVVIVLLWLAIVATIRRFYPLSKAAAILFLPYLLWVSFAAVLTFAVWRLNM